MAVKEHIQRLMLIARRIKSHRYITSKELSSYMEEEMNARGYKLACSKRTLQRDFQELREDFYVDIVYNSRHRGYEIIDGEGGNIEELFEGFDMIYVMGADGALPSYIITEPSKPRGTKHLSDILDAIKNKRKISFAYNKYTKIGTEVSGSVRTNDKQESERLVSPYIVKESRGRWYVIGKEKGGEIKTFGLDRIDRLQTSMEKAERTDFDVEARFRDSFGIYSDERYPVENIVLAFSPEDGAYIKSVPLHHSQRTIKDTAEEFIISLRLRLTLDFLMELMSRSWSLRVIEPKILRDRVCEVWKDALKRNEKVGKV